MHARQWPSPWLLPCLIFTLLSPACDDDDSAGEAGGSGGAAGMGGFTDPAGGAGGTGSEVGPGGEGGAAGEVGSTDVWQGMDLAAVEDPTTLGFDAEALRAGPDALADDIEDGGIPGAILLIARKGQIALYEELGVHSTDNPTSLTGDSLFRIFSMTKPIVSVATMSMVEDGLLDLDDPVSDYLPEFAEMTVLQEDGSTIPAMDTMTVRQLMSHTSGIIYGGLIRGDNFPLSQLYIEAGALPLRLDITLRELAGIVGELPLLSEPGGSWNYGLSTDILGAVIEVAAEQTLDEILRARVLDPLGMHDTSFYPPVSEGHRLARTSAPYPESSPELRAPQPMLSAGGGLTSTTRDYLRFCMMLANEGQLDGVRVVEAASIAEMRVNHVTEEMREDQFTSVLVSNGTGFGLGVQVVLEDRGRRREGSGTVSWGGFLSTQFWVDPTNDVITILMLQREAPNRYSIPIRRWVYDALVDQ
ncbi:MAG: serine hydrolase domain-containing protein [Bradymonadia bacterium]